MLAATDAIVLHRLRYGEGSLIVKLFTREFGLQSAIVNSAFIPKAAIKASALMPGNIAQVQMYVKPQREVQRLKELHLSPVLPHLSADVRKAHVCLFCTEVLAKVLQPGGKAEDLFDGSRLFFLHLNDLESPTLAWQPILFLLDVLGHCGFGLEPYASEVVSGTAMAFPGAPMAMAGRNEASLHLQQVLAGRMEAEMPPLDRQQRSMVLHWLLAYLSWHMPGTPAIKSVSILEGLG